jgi:hypothetical protein
MLSKYVRAVCCCPSIKQYCCICALVHYYVLGAVCLQTNGHIELVDTTCNYERDSYRVSAKYIPEIGPEACESVKYL